jgi:hypothetical protein
MIPAVPRIPDISDMIDGKFYFIIHAPRQSGKTTCLTALTDRINSDGRYYAVNCSLAYLRDTADDEKAMGQIVDQIDAGLRLSKVDEIRKLAFSFDTEPYMAKAGTKVRLMLNDLCQALNRDLVIFFDEADCLRDEPLIKFLVQIRDGYLYRSDEPAARFPRSLALVGMRDIRDYLYTVRPVEKSTGLASPFNVKEKSLSLTDFTREEIETLYGQHTADTGQVFEPEAVYRAWHWTEGQPWLVNALAKDVISKRIKNDFSRHVTAADIDLAAYDMMLSGATHLDSLMERLKEPRVRKVIEPVIAGADSLPKDVLDDIGYVIDLGLLKTDSDVTVSLRPSNPIYGELIARAMSREIQSEMPLTLAGRWMDGTRLDMDGLLKAFQVYWRENSDANEKSKTEGGSTLSLVDDLQNLVDERIAQVLGSFGASYNEQIQRGFLDTISGNMTGFARESYPHIVLFAFLQRVANGGAQVLREYALGKTRVDICVIYKDIRYPVELKIKGVQSLENSLEQLSGYMDRCSSSAGWLVVFDRDLKKPWSEKITWDTVVREGKTIRLVGC